MVLHWSLETIQRRAISIIFPVTVGMPYIFALDYVHIPSLHSHDEEANKRFLGLSLTLPLEFSSITSTEIALLELLD